MQLLNVTKANNSHYASRVNDLFSGCFTCGNRRSHTVAIERIMKKQGAVLQSGVDQ